LIEKREGERDISRLDWFLFLYRHPSMVAYRTTINFFSYTIHSSPIRISLSHHHFSCFSHMTTSLFSSSSTNLTHHWTPQRQPPLSTQTSLPTTLSSTNEQHWLSGKKRQREDQEREREGGRENQSLFGPKLHLHVMLKLITSVGRKTRWSHSKS